jgi:hypothetical protein
VRTLPLRLSPIEGESLPGYVVRYAHTFQLPPGEVVRAFGLADTMLEAGRSGMRLSAQQLERVSTATGIDRDQLQAMVLARFAGRAFPRASSSAPNAVPPETRTHELTWRSRFCPRCLREHGAWLLRWQLSWSVLCTRHDLLLARRCRRCGAIPRIGRDCGPATIPGPTRRARVRATAGALRSSGRTCAAGMVSIRAHGEPVSNAAGSPMGTTRAREVGAP